ncbi:phospholipase D-like domain-containing protein [Bacilliculturomica massiliensis]|uniref:hypothetical protein n=1 Tax=Bacilliculturomica massiliensis TaxID=1917867 RepID=UPI001031CD68|nr:hypothetical protein [Bacilliculturomica massiliensis]
MTIDTDGRLEYGSVKSALARLFAPKKGCEVRRAFMTTFTLNSRMIADALLHMGASADGITGGGNSPEAGGGLSDLSELQKRLMLERYYQRYVGRRDPERQLHVFAHDFDDVLKKTYNCSSRKNAGVDLFCSGIVEKELVTFVRPPSAGAFFHPKIMLAEFAPEGGEERTRRFYRLIVSSKNMVYDRFFQLGMVLEGWSGRQTANGKAVADFLLLLSQQRQGEKRDGKEEDVRRLLTALAEGTAGTEFAPAEPGSCGKVSFHFNVPPALRPDSQGLDSQRPEKTNFHLKNQLERDFSPEEDRARRELAGPDGAYRYLFLCDSLNADFPRLLLGDETESERILFVSNPSSWERAFENGGRSAIPSYAYLLKEGVGQGLTDDECCGEGRPYIHAKLYARFGGGRTVVWAGSANGTRNAVSENFECMARYEYETDPTETGGDRFEEIRRWLEPVTPERLEEYRCSRSGERERLLELLRELLQEQTVFSCSVLRSGRLSVSVSPAEGRRAAEEDPGEDDPWGLPEPFQFYFTLPGKCGMCEFSLPKSENSQFEIHFTQEQFPADRAGLVRVARKMEDVALIPVRLRFEEDGDPDAGAELGRASGAKNSVDAEAYIRLLYKNMLPKLRDFVPPLSGEAPFPYDSADTAEMRLCKYAVDRGWDRDGWRCGKIAAEIQGFLEKVGIDEDEDDLGAYDYAALRGELARFRHKAEEFRSYLKEWEDGADDGRRR